MKALADIFKVTPSYRGRNSIAFVSDVTCTDDPV